MDFEDGAIIGVGCLSVVLWLFWIFCLVMLAADFFDLGFAITDKL